MKLELENSDNVFMSEMERLSKNDLSKIKEQFKDESNENNYKKILNNLELLLEGQEVRQKDLQLGFIGLAKQNRITLLSHQSGLKLTILSVSEHIWNSLYLKDLSLAN